MRDARSDTRSTSEPPASTTLVPLIQNRTDGSYDLTRLLVVKVASINTTAAGGNASLISLAGE